jgi:hypothetical protein
MVGVPLDAADQERLANFGSFRKFPNSHRGRR